MDDQPHSENGDCTDQPAQEPPPQYSLQSLFLATTLFAVACGVCFALPNEIAGLAIIALSLVVPMCLLAWAIYGSGPKRAFCIGALLVTGPRALEWSSTLINSLGYLFPGRLTGDGNVSSVLSFDELFKAIVTIGLAWRPGVVLSWLGGAAAGLIIVVAGRIARQQKAQDTARSDRYLGSKAN